MKMQNNNEMYADKNCTTTHSPNSSCSHHKNSSVTPPTERETFSPLSDKELEGCTGGLFRRESIWPHIVWEYELRPKDPYKKLKFPSPPKKKKEQEEREEE
ncbi:hypothetical protein [Dapis sp. BLCC M229]|uniref:hypothetical protein n=1 Tax=Dapis sp. BLCC M229 TaxID=3400188 RepID=UPI003CF4705F